MRGWRARVEAWGVRTRVHLAGAEKLLRDDEGAEGVGGTASSVADVVGVSLVEASRGGGVAARQKRV